MVVQNGTRVKSLIETCFLKLKKIGGTKWDLVEKFDRDAKKLLLCYGRPFAVMPDLQRIHLSAAGGFTKSARS